MRHRLLRGLLGLAAAVWTAPALATGDVAEFTLENGMQAVVIEDHRSPAVVHMVWYRVGAADEPPGQSGIAHFLEHLMFKGTDDLAAGEFSQIVEANGGTDNAFTSWDYTGYIQRVSADRLGLMMEMEADRMRDLALDPEMVDTERSVILEERAQRTDSSPGALYNEQLRAALYLNHPYRIPVIGWRHEMEDLTREEALAFYSRYYAPNNAILIVAGDVDPDEVRALAEQHYGPLEPTPGLEPRARPSEPPQNADRRVIYEDPTVASPYVSRSYLAPERDPGDQETAAALSLLAEILGGGQTSLLSRVLQTEEQVSLYSAAFYDGLNLDDGSFTLLNVPVPGRSLEEAEADLDRMIARFLEEGIDPAQFERVKFLYEASEIYAEDDTSGLARRYGTALTSGLTVEDVAAWPEVIAATTIDDVMEAARMVFGQHSVTGYLTVPDAEDAE
ncbi:insulinase family protein [Rhodobacterales bacterium HKCCE2091]|nr:insulinase family protein [Rhodobacterales bacterium HKCCE2091]